MNRERPFDSKMRAWLKDNLARGCNRREIVDILQSQGFSIATIKQQMGMSYPLDTPRSTEPLTPPPLIRKSPPNLQRFPSDAIELYTLDKFMSEKECDRLNALIGHHLRPSTITLGRDPTGLRISQTCDLGYLRSPVAIAADDKICKTLGISAEYGESIQAQRYDVGGEFKAHYDFFVAGAEYVQNSGDYGNRTWTFMVYLNDGMEGGGTHFHELNHTFVPRKGQAVLWNNLKPDRTTNPATRHSGEPVTAGHKIIITKWFREYGAGPMYLP